MSDAPPTEDVVFGNTVDALFLKALGTKLSMRCVERVKEAGIDLRSKLTRAMGFAGAKNCSIRREAYDGARCTYRITWTP